MPGSVPGSVFLCSPCLFAIPSMRDSIPFRLMLRYKHSRASGSSCVIQDSGWPPTDRLDYPEPKGLCRPMWIRKFERDRNKGVTSPVPTQMLSTEEFIPRPQNERQKHVEHLIGEMSEQKAKKLAMDRRKFMGTSMGLATCFSAMNAVYGKAFDVDEAETTEEETTAEKWPKGEYFVMDVQSHFTNGIPIGLRGDIGKMEFFKNMGFTLKDDKESYSFHNFVKEMFFDSETDMIVISGVPGKEQQRDKEGKVLEGAARTPFFAILPSWLMAQAREEINALAQ